MFRDIGALSCPGLFVTGTDTGVGKTVVTCAVAAALCGRGQRVGVCKPFATGCRREREGLVNDDAQALAHFADCRQPLEVINPIRYADPLAPAVAATQTGQPPDLESLANSLERIDQSSDVVLIEGVGGLLVPLDDDHTVLDLITALGYPVLIVTRAGLGTLNHTAMTVRLLKQTGCRVAGLVINGYTVDAAEDDPSMVTNPRWLAKMNRSPVLVTVPSCQSDQVDPGKGILPPAVLEAIDGMDWLAVLKRPKMMR